MKEELKLASPIKINGKTVGALAYDTDEITCDLFAQAEGQKVRATGGAAKGVMPGAVELDYTFHLYLGFAAVVAASPEIDFEDLKQLKGGDVMEAMKIGRNFMLPRQGAPSAGEGSEAQSGSTPGPSTSPPPASGDGG